MNDTQFILGCLENIAINLEEIVALLAPEQSSIYVDEEQKINCISVNNAMAILENMGRNSASEMIGKTDYILVYDSSKKLIIDGEAYLPSGYLVMKSDHGLQGLEEMDVNAVITELRSRSCTLNIGQHRINAYKLS